MWGSVWGVREVMSYKGAVYAGDIIDLLITLDEKCITPFSGNAEIVGGKQFAG